MKRRVVSLLLGLALCAGLTGTAFAAELEDGTQIVTIGGSDVIVTVEDGKITDPNLQSQWDSENGGSGSNPGIGGGIGGGTIGGGSDYPSYNDPTYDPVYDPNWYPTTPSVPSYSVGNTSGSNVSGSWSTDKYNAKEGDTVTITVTPAAGMRGVPTVKDWNGNTVNVTKLGSNRFSFTMPRSSVTISVDFTPIPPNPFVDVSEGQYFYDAVQWAVENGITNGNGSANRFDPNVTCTRAQIVTFLWRANGSPLPRSGSTGFTDVPSDRYYADAVKWAVENGITNGNGSADKFDPNAACSRAQIVTFLWRAKGTPAPRGGVGFTDVPTNQYYYNAVQWAVENGITDGNGSATIFSPKVDCSRAHIVTFLYRAYAE